MPPPRHKTKARHSQRTDLNSFPFLDVLKSPLNLVRSLLFDYHYIWHLAALLLAGELMLSLFIIKYIAYTEIDWVAYMQEVSGFINGERDYTKLAGDTGPLVYPAGFVYVYSLLYHLTESGRNIRHAQYLFGSLYIGTQAMVFGIYAKSKRVPPYTLIILTLSKRLHSIYLLRCFNDPVAMFLFYACVLAAVHRKWTVACFLYSLALSVKMNILLYFPAFGLLLWKSTGAYRTIVLLILIVGIQLLLALPFLVTFPYAYFSRAFEFSRVFNYKWTVNWRLVDEDTFLHPQFALALVIGHAVVLSAFLVFRWCESEGGVLTVFFRGFTASTMEIKQRALRITPDHMVILLFTSNLIGMVFARSLHYQFYAWYFHSLPFLLWHCGWGSPPAKPESATQSVAPLAAVERRAKGVWNLLIRLCILATIESCWLTFPSTRNSSTALLACHALILLGLWQGDAEGIVDNRTEIKKEREKIKVKARKN